ncbi:MAG: lipid-A-disaccharide synthase-related protein [Synechococcales cyanobacterium]
MAKRVLFLSNGHGEDLNAVLMIQALRQRDPDLEIWGMPLVGEGGAYRRAGIAVIVPTRPLPSGGFVYMNYAQLLRDAWAGLLSLLWQQWQVIRRQGRQCDLAVAVGDIYPILLAHLTGQPFAVFLISASSHYEGRTRLPWLTWRLLHSPRCRQVFSRDAFTASDLQQRGLAKAAWVGNPLLDDLLPQTPLPKPAGIPTFVLLPGSRLPEALRNLTLLLQVCAQAGSRFHYWVALVSAMTPEHLQKLHPDWQYQSNQQPSGQNPSGSLVYQDVRVECLWGRFADALHHCDGVLGMAGTAVEQAVGLGKPVLQLAGQGPQFTYRFAEAQMRLLGPSVQTFRRIEDVVARMDTLFRDPDYLERCRSNGRERLGIPGGSHRLAKALLALP